jgi:hypothetical protein
LELKIETVKDLASIKPEVLTRLFGAWGARLHEFGGFFTTGSNAIVLNRVPLQRIVETRPELYKPYIFHVLLHEYIHSLGYLDEEDVKQKVYNITKEALGDAHLATQIAADARGFIKDLAYPGISWKPEDEGLELVAGFDRSSASYIS